MIKYHTIDNLIERNSELSTSKAEGISEMITDTILKEAKNTEYNQETMDFILSHYTPERILERSNKGFLIYGTDENNRVIGSGMIVKTADGFEPQCWYVPEEYRPKGVALDIGIRLKKRLKKLGLNEVTFKVYKFKSALDLYTRIGCKKIGEHESGRYVVFRMKL
jgi:RimJ/RimL family protein N-acetyltransferase